MWRRRTIGSCACVDFFSSLQRHHNVSVLLADVGGRIKGQRQAEKGGEEVDMEDVLDDFQHKARDHARIPMQASVPNSPVQRSSSDGVVLQWCVVGIIALAVLRGPGSKLTVRFRSLSTASTSTSVMSHVHIFTPSLCHTFHWSRHLFLFFDSFLFCLLFFLFFLLLP